MRQFYLRINYGCDDRFKMVSKTIRTHAPFFHEIKVVNFGPDANSDKFAKLVREFPNVRVASMGRYYHACITEDLLRYHYMDVPEGDWCAWLDSDWRLTPYFLDHMQEEVEMCERTGANHLFSYQSAHYKNKENHEEHTQEFIDKLVKGWEANPGAYGFPILQRVNKANIYCNGFMGNHSYVVHVPYNRRNVPRMYHLHIRDFSDHGYCSSMAHQSWWYIGHNVFKLEEQEGVYGSWEFDTLEAFKIKHRCFTSNDLHEMKKDPAFLEELRKLWSQFGESKVFGCQQMYRMATQYDMKFLNTDPEERPCSGLCCSYKNGRICDLTA